MPYLFARRFCLLTFLIVGSFAQVFSQNYSGLNWYFGNSARGIRFIRPTLNPEAVTTPYSLGLGRSGVASDPITGEIIFVTDGNLVYDGMDRVLSTALNGQTSSNQGVAVAQNPANRNQYYIFTIDNGTNLLEFTIFDRSLYSGPPAFPAPPVGNIVGTPSNTGLPVSARSAAMIIIPNSNKDGYWLISHQSGTTTYDVVEINALGVFANTPQSVGSITNAVNLSYNSKTSQIAVSPSSPSQTVEVLAIDQSTGTLSLVTNIPDTDRSFLITENIFDTEWSNSGDYLYISGNFGNAPDSLIQVDMTQVPPVLSALNTTSVSRSYGLQMAPDSAIYHIYQTVGGAFQVGRINEPDTVASQTLYEPIPLGKLDFGGRQFPAFLPQIDPALVADFSFSGVCQNSPTLFYPSISPGADSVRWDFGDGGVSRQLVPYYTYPDAADYNATLTAFLNGDSVKVPKPITINAFDIQISVISDTTFCREDFPPPYGINGTASVVASVSGTPVSVLWSNGDSGNTLTPDSSGYYYVIATDASGCSTYAGVTVNTYGEEEQRANVWYFGNNAGIDFNPLPDDPVAPIPFGDPNVYNGGNQMQAPQGCAIYCDRNGQPLFYSDGVDVYDSNGDQLTGSDPADKIGGDQTATQSVMIVPFPGDETLFYIFTTQEVYGTGAFDLKYAVFDLKDETNGTKGALVRTDAGDLTTTLCTNVTERITGNENWIITHDYGNNNFKVYPIASDGIGSPTISSVGSPHDSDRKSEGYMKLGPNNLLAVALSVSDNENYIEIFNFIDSTGALTEMIQLDFSDPIYETAGVDGVTLPASLSGQVYGIGFSPGGDNLFATLQGTVESHLLWWRLDSTTSTANTTDLSYIRDSVRYVSGSNFMLGTLQAGPDGVLYIAQEGQDFVATITNPDLDIPQVPVIGSFGLAGSTSRLGLPNFIQNIGNPSDGASLQVMNGCDGDEITVSILNAQNLEDYYVNIYEDGNQTTPVRGTVVLTQDNPDFTFTLDRPGDYVATVTVNPQCSGFSNFNMPPQTFVVNPLPDFVLAQVQPPSACGVDDGIISVTINMTDNVSYSVNGPVSYAATNVAGPGTFNIENLSAGFYTVTTASLTTGCSDTRTFSLNDTRPYTPDDQVVNSKCSGQEGELNITFTPATAAPATYRWRLLNQGSNTEVASGTETDIPFQFISTGEYYLEIIEGLCTTTASVSATPPPAIDLTLPFEFSVCDSEVARVPYVTASSQLVSVSPTMEVEGDSIILITRPGTYVVTAFGDGINTCDIQQSLTVTFPESDPIPFDSRYAICPEDPLEENKFVTIPVQGFSSVEYLDEDGFPLRNGTGYTIFSDSIRVFVTGTITIRMTNAFGCVSEAEVDIIEDCKARIKAPKAFSPNGDGINDNFLIFPVLVSSEDFQIFIFNRWGEMVFQSSDLNFQWNGGYDNDPARPLTGGAYAYKVEFKSIIEGRDDVQEMRGGVTLIR